MFDALDRKNLLRIKHELVDLLTHFRQTNHLLQIPILISLNTHTWSIVACFCLMFNMDSSKYESTRLINTIFWYSFLKLVFLLVHGNYAELEYAHLVWQIRISIRNWSPLDWIHMNQLEFMKKKFKFTLFSICSLEQAFASSLFGFILHYLAVLIQTDNKHS